VTAASPPALTPSQSRLLDAIRQIAAAKPQYNQAFDSQIRERQGALPAWEDFVALLTRGLIIRRHLPTCTPPWAWRPASDPTPVLPCDDATVRENLERVLGEARGEYPRAFFDNVRARFVWFDATGNDVFRPVAEALAVEGVCRLEWFEARNGQRYELFDLATRFADGPEDTPTDRPAVEEPDDPPADDFVVLNALEDAEKDQINFGAYETAFTVAEVAQRMGRETSPVAAALDRLAAHHLVLRLGDCFRSRMAELAREVRYVKQRFRPGDAVSRPFVVRAIQVRTIDRDKPRFNRELLTEVEALKVPLAGVPHAAKALDLLEPMLRTAWGKEAGKAITVSGFQARALAQLLPAYFGVAPQLRTFVVVADTGSGKTESAALPLIAAAAADRFAGTAGVKAVLVYPRIRLLCNQAQRLAHYLSALPPHQCRPLLTIGLQTGDAPRFFPPGGGDIKIKDLAEAWPWSAEHKGYRFPFFNCPAKTCLTPGGERLMLRRGGSGIDSLSCPACGWRFDGWVGTKNGLRATPPDFFLVVTESLHQWLQDPEAGRLFGDDSGFPPPRALVADEIHLYAHIAGMQVGYALRRLLARAAINVSNRPPALAVGMSATLGRPAEVWNSLIGRTDAVEIRPSEDPADKERDTNPQAREYFYFVQPVVESRSKRVPGVSTTIQALMCLAHGMRRRQGDRGGYRALAFVDSIDQVVRLHEDYRNAEMRNNLAKYRTCAFPPHAAGQPPRQACCGQPATCARFAEGECWFFAARAPDSNPATPNDPYQTMASGPYVPGRPLTVARNPVYSGTKGRVEEMIRTSDLVISTSSLEVGYDDPDMILVYQHYAPVNLASFIQRKGRAGRSSDDRPVTGITLSVYSPRDWWYFRHPDAMLDARDFEVPLNPGNVFVRRGQALSALLDAAARASRRSNTPMPQPNRVNLAALFAFVEDDPDSLALLRAVAGGIIAELGCADLTAFWRKATANARAGVGDDWRDVLPWVPQQLFDDINLPLLRVSWPPAWEGDRGWKNEEVGLVFGECAPGNATRRYGPSRALWLPPPDPAAPGTLTAAPPLGPDGYDRATYEDLLDADQFAEAGNDEQEIHRLITRELPGEVSQRLSAGQLFHHQLCRPGGVQLAVLGEMDRDGRWQPRWYWDAAQRRVIEGTPPSQDQGVHHKSSARLLGFPLLRANRGMGKERLLRGLSLLARGFHLYQGDPAGQGRTGLSVARAFWGAEVRLVLGARGQDTESWSFTFTDRDGQPRLHGYHLETEGVSLTPAAESLDAFVAAELERINRDAPWSRWLHGQFFRYLISTRFAGAGLSTYAAGPLADLFVAANAMEELRTEFVDQWRQGVQSETLEALLRQAHAEALLCHPFLGAERLDEYLQEIHHPRFAELFRQSIADINDAAQFRGYMRTLVLHGLALSLHELFVLHGRGDERRVLLHARLPVQFDEPSDTLTVFEAGDHGDGTTRTFDRHREHAFAVWRRGELGDCPFAAEDAITEQLFGHMDRHVAWREAGTPDAEGLREIGRMVTGTLAVSEVHLQRLRTVLFDEEQVGTRSFALYDLMCEIRAVRLRLQQTFGRRPMAWELVSASVAAADAADPLVPRLGDLLRAYSDELDIGSEDEAIGPRSRLAEQVHRLGAAQCADGCRACLHRATTLMNEEQTAATVSREVLARYREWVLAPLTVRIEREQDIPSADAIDRQLRVHGIIRLLVAPQVYEAGKQAFTDRGFSEQRPGGYDPVYDPLLAAVVCLRETVS
jgi:hypothetical protein